jgi:hypothetical protein
MRRWLIGSALTAIVVGHVTATPRALPGEELRPIVDRFLEASEPSPTAFVAVRRLEAGNAHFNATAWMDVRTEADANGFRYAILEQGGSGYIRSKVFMPALETEQEMWGGANRGAFTLDNYTFADPSADPQGLVSVGVKPKRKDVLLVNGAILLRPQDSDLVRVQGSLSKTPSFWTRRVEIIREYARIAGVRLPVRLESTAHILVAGKSTMTMTYHYESVNGAPVDHPLN